MKIEEFSLYVMNILFLWNDMENLFKWIAADSFGSDLSTNFLNSLEIFSFNNNSL